MECDSGYLKIGYVVSAYGIPGQRFRASNTLTSLTAHTSHAPGRIKFSNSIFPLPTELDAQGQATPAPR